MLEFTKDGQTALIYEDDKKIIEKFLKNGYQLKTDIIENNSSDDIIEVKEEIKEVAKKQRSRSKKGAE